MDEQRLVEVFRAKNAIHASLLKAALEEGGIKARIDGQHLQGMLSYDPVGRINVPRLLVLEPDVDRAVAIIRQLEGDQG
jgi:Putative prokaryotic signal transducing protein